MPKLMRALKSQKMSSYSKENKIFLMVKFDVLMSNPNPNPISPYTASYTWQTRKSIAKKLIELFPRKQHIIRNQIVHKHKIFCRFSAKTNKHLYSWILICLNISRKKKKKKSGSWYRQKVFSPFLIS